jgi:hypothetical protein
MTSVTTKLELSQPQTETAVHLFDNWFDPIEAGVRAHRSRKAALTGGLRISQIRG